MAPVYSAKFSNVPVWVSTVNNVSVMRRQNDGWVNATHLLKVANFEKPKRTRILERDVQTGEHEKVQGGYGKYQGTWIPVDRAVELSKQVEILDMVESLLSYSADDGPAPEEMPKIAKAPAARKQPSGTTLSGQKPKRARKTPSVSHPGPIAPNGYANINGSGHQNGGTNGLSTNVGHNMAQPPLNSAVPPTPGMHMPYPNWQYSPAYNQGGGAVMVPPNGQMIPPNNGPMMHPGNGQMIPPSAPPGSVQSSMPPQNPMNMANGDIHHPMMMPYPPAHPYETGNPNRPPSMVNNEGSPMAKQLRNQSAAGNSNSSSPSLSSSVLSSRDGFDGDFSQISRSQYGPPSQLADNSVNMIPNSSQHMKMGNMSPGALSLPAASAQTAARSNAWTKGPSHYMADYSSKLLNFFMSPDKSVIPASLLEPDPGMDLDYPIDDEGNTAFHWTCAIGRVELMRALLAAGVNKHAINKSGQTALGFLVMFTNNYETRTFPQVLDILGDQIAFVDPKQRTILHQIANTATGSSRSATARYYLEILLAKVSSGAGQANQSHGDPTANGGVNLDSNSNGGTGPSTGAVGGGAASPTARKPAASASVQDKLMSPSNPNTPTIGPHNFGSWINHQDYRGDTALHIASRLDSRRLVKVLLSYHASPLVPNKQGQTPEDLYLQVKKQREVVPMPVPPPPEPMTTGPLPGRQSSVVVPSLNEKNTETRRFAEQISLDISSQLRTIAGSVDQDLADKDSDLTQVQTLIAKIHQDIAAAESVMPSLRAEMGNLDHFRTELAQIQAQANEKLTQVCHLIERQQARDLAGVVQQEEAKVSSELANQLNDENPVDQNRYHQLTTELAELQQQRKQLVGEIGALYSESGSQEKIAKYRRLLAVCCEVPENLVDGLLDGINQALDAPS